MWKLPGLLTSAFLLSASLLLASSPTTQAISSSSFGGGIADYYDSDNDGQYDRANLIISAQFTRVDTPQDDEYIYARLQDVTNGVNDRQLDNLLVNQNRTEAFINFNENGAYEVGNTYKFRICAEKLVVQEPEDSICTEDIEIPLESDPTEPDVPVDPENPSQEYPSYGFMVGTQLALISGFAIVVVLVSTYSPRSRR